MSTESSFDFGLGEVQSVADRIRGEREARQKLNSRILGFGIRFLDDVFGGIYANDLIVAAARTGLGKSQLAMITAAHNALKGRRVLLFALESERLEVERRLKYSLIVQKYFDAGGYNIPLSYRGWYSGQLDSFLGKLEQETDDEIVERYRSLRTFYRGVHFGADELARICRAEQDRTDLVVCDHLHFLDGPDDQPENRALKETIKTIRNLVLTSDIPVLLLAHVRKSDRNSTGILPSIEDIHGSSDVSKLATKIVVFGKAPRDHTQPAGKSATYFQAVKDRTDGSVSAFTGLCVFDFAKNTYDGGYALGFLNGDRFKPVDKLPHWAKGARQ